MQRIAFLGLGRMGAGMAARLLAAGRTVTVYNRTAARAEPLVRAGARLARSPREACDGADAVIAMSADDASSRAMWLGENGALAAKHAPHALAIECSTLSHGWVLELAREAAQRGLRYLDAPVTGLPDVAAAGELTLLVGASTADLDAARPNSVTTSTVVCCQCAPRPDFNISSPSSSPRSRCASTPCAAP